MTVPDSDLYRVAPRTSSRGDLLAPESVVVEGEAIMPYVRIHNLAIGDSADTRGMWSLAIRFSVFNIDTANFGVRVGFMQGHMYPVVSCQLFPLPGTKLRVLYRCDASVTLSFDPWSFPTHLFFQLWSAGRPSHVIREPVSLFDVSEQQIRAARLVDALGCVSDDKPETHETILGYLRAVRWRRLRSGIEVKVESETPYRVIDRYIPSDLAAYDDKKRSVCIVTQDIIGPIRTGGVGTWCLGLAQTLREAGHEVTILYSQGMFEQGSEDLWSYYYRSMGISLEFLPEPAVDLIGSSALTLSVSIYLWLKERSFDVVHLHEMNGCGYHTLAAKQTGLAFAETVLCVGLHGPASWHRYYNKQFVCWNEELTRYWMEQASLRLADVAFSPSQYLFTWAQSQGWELPKRCWVMPHPLPKLGFVDTHSDARPSQEEGANRRRKVTEVAFFGRLETRKGLELFCDALELLEEEYGNELRVVFIGKPGLARRMAGLEYLEARVHKWRFAVTVEPDLSRDEALNYLSRGAKVVVIPSLADSTSYTLYECLQARLPLLCADDTGLSEVLHPEDSGEVMFTPTIEALARKLRDVLEKGAIAPRAMYDLSRVNYIWQAFHNEHLFEACDNSTPAFSLGQGSASLPLVSVCVTHHDRPPLLEIALDSIVSQSYSNIEVIVIDDGSSSADIEQELARIEKTSAPFPVRVVRGSNRFPGASRNIAVGLARGEFILFLDDDNVMKRDAVAVLVRAAQTSGAQIISPWCDVFTGSGDPRAFEPCHAYWLLAGPAVAAGTMSNVFGDSFSLWDRATFLRLGGFSEDPMNDTEDWELLARAQFAGCSHANVPEALIWYRRSAENFDRIRSYPAAMRRLRPYGEQVSDRFFDVVLLTNGMEREVEGRTRGMKLSSPAFSQAWLRATFHSSQMILFSTYQSRGFADLTTSEHMQVARQENELEFTAVGNDPQMYFPEFVHRGEERIVIRVKMTASRATFAQVFYKLSKHDDYQEERSVVHAIPEGLSEVFLLPREPYVRGVIRLDPAGHEGEYIIHSVEIRGLA